jgi:hypothetical protein
VIADTNKVGQASGGSSVKIGSRRGRRLSSGPLRRRLFDAAERTKPGHLKINPKGREPALVTDRGVLTETPAILAYIAGTHPENPAGSTIRSRSSSCRLSTLISAPPSMSPRPWRTSVGLS